jgi:hypothetical protein
MEFNTTQEATGFVAAQEHRILWNLAVHCCVHNSPSLDPILSRTNAGNAT